MTTRYRMLRDSTLEPKAVAGTIVYAASGYDYGMAAIDAHLTGEPHVSVTLDPGGAYPFFTVPESDVERLS